MATVKLNRTGITRAIDELGRIVVPKEFRNMAGLKPGDLVMTSLVTDTDGQLRGFLLEPVSWLLGQNAPTFEERLRESVGGRGEDDERC